VHDGEIRRGHLAHLSRLVHFVEEREQAQDDRTVRRRQLRNHHFDVWRGRQTSNSEKNRRERNGARCAAMDASALSNSDDTANNLLRVLLV
jgi:hypothetical protein